MDEDDKWAQKARLRLGALKKSVDDDEDLQDACPFKTLARQTQSKPLAYWIRPTNLRLLGPARGDFCRTPKRICMLQSAR